MFRTEPAKRVSKKRKVMARIFDTSESELVHSLNSGTRNGAVFLSTFNIVGVGLNLSYEYHHITSIEIAPNEAIYA